MKIKLENTAIELTPRVTGAYNHKTRKAVAIPLEGAPGAYIFETEDLEVAADCIVNRGWLLVEPAVLALPVTPNEQGLQFPREFVASAKAKRLLTIEEVEAAQAKVDAKKAKTVEVPTDEQIAKELGDQIPVSPVVTGPEGSKED